MNSLAQRTGRRGKIGTIRLHNQARGHLTPAEFLASFGIDA
jgi:hypothetical protein